MGSSGGTTESKSLTGAERANIFNYGMSSVGSGQNSGIFNNTGYTAPEYQSSNYQQMAGGDYNAYRQALYDGSTAGLRQYEGDARAGIDQSLSDRGLWSSGIAQAAQNDLTEGIADSYAQAGANSTAQALAMKQQDLQGMNTFNQNATAMENQFNQGNAQQEYAAKWAPLEYLLGMYNQTGGAVSTSKGGGGGLPFNLSF